MQSMPPPDGECHIIVGVDTHKYVHVAVAVNSLGLRLGELVIGADTGGYRQVEEWSRTWGHPVTFGVEGTNSYGRGLSSYLLSRGHRVIEVSRPDRRNRRLNGKSDSLDAEVAARSVLAGTARATAKPADGMVEMIREVKLACDGARKARTAALLGLKALLINAPAPIRESLAGLSSSELIARCAGFRPGSVDTPAASIKFALRALARRCLYLDEEMSEQRTVLDELTTKASPTLREGYCIGADSAAELLIALGDNPERLRSEAAFAKLCGAAPLPASSGLTNRHRLSRGGDRRANAALHRIVIVRMHHEERTQLYVARRTAEGLSKKDVIRCLKRAVAREVFSRVMADYSPVALADVA